jgi:hypothetical protein
MAKAQKITFSKEYVLEVVVAELRKRHSIPENFVTKVREYGDDFLSFVEIVPTETEVGDEES